MLGTQDDVVIHLLFNIFIKDIMKGFDNTECCTHYLIDMQVGSLLYADDQFILSTSEDSRLHNSVNRLTEYCRKWKLNVNMSETKIMCLSSSTKYVVNFQIKCHECL